MSERKIKIAIIGGGSRGTCYANYAARHPESVEVVAIAEPRNHYRNVMAARFNIPDELAVEDWSELAEMPKFADAAIIATSDALHTEPAIVFAAERSRLSETVVSI